MLVNVKCKKSGDTGKLDIGSLTREQIEERREKPSTYGYSCGIGHHVELSGNMLTCLEIDWNTAQEGSAPKDEDVIEELKKHYTFVGNTTEAGLRFDFESFGFGCAMVTDKNTGKRIALDYKALPSGPRVYYGNV